MNIDTCGLLPITAEECIGRFMAILGITGSGKTNTAAVIMEELLAAGIPTFVIDVAGEYYTLKEKFERVTVIGRSLTTETDVKLDRENIGEVAEKAYLAGAPVVFDVSNIEEVTREDMLLVYLDKIWTLSAKARIPLVIFLEEAHNWCPQVGKTAVSDRLVKIATEGRKRGLSLVMISQRSASVHKNTLTQADVAFLHYVRHPADLNVYIGMIPRPPRRVKESVHGLKKGEALVLIDGRVLRQQIRLRHSRHVGFTPGLDNIPAQQLSLLDLL